MTSAALLPRSLVIGLGLFALSLGPLPAQAAPSSLAPQALEFAGASVRVLVVPPGTPLRAVAAPAGRTVLGWARATGAVAALNGGYFNHSDGWPVSHVSADGRALTNPRANRALAANPALKPLLGTIFDARVEWRALEGPAGTSWAIAPHAAPLPPATRLRYALQAGPRLLPDDGLEREAFVRRGVRGNVLGDGIGSRVRAARSALGVRPDGTLTLVAVAAPARGRGGLTIAQLAQLMRHLGAREAMALDGGSSTALVWQANGRYRQFGGGARVNSALVVGAR